MEHKQEKDVKKTFLFLVKEGLSFGESVLARRKGTPPPPYKRREKREKTATIDSIPPRARERHRQRHKTHKHTHTR